MKKYRYIKEKSPSPTDGKTYYSLVTEEGESVPYEFVSGLELVSHKEVQGMLKGYQSKLKDLADRVQELDAFRIDDKMLADILGHLFTLHGLIEETDRSGLEEEIRTIEDTLLKRESMSKDVSQSRVEPYTE